MKEGNSPYERMAEMYAEHPQAQSFTWYLDWYSRHGFVFITPDYFIMGRPVQREADPRLISDPRHLFAAAESDCWYIHAMAGNLAQVWAILPWPLPWIAFERLRGGKLELAFYLTEILKRHCLSDLDHEFAQHVRPAV